MAIRLQFINLVIPVTTLERLRALQHLREWIPLLPHGVLTPLDTLAPDEQYFQTLGAAPIPGPALKGLREYYAILPIGSATV